MQLWHRRLIWRKSPRKATASSSFQTGADDCEQDELRADGKRVTQIKDSAVSIAAGSAKTPESNDWPQPLATDGRRTGYRGVVIKADSGNVPSRHWAEMMHSLIEVADRVDFDLNTPLGSPARLDVLASTPDGKRDKAVEISCPRYVSPQ